MRPRSVKSQLKDCLRWAQVRSQARGLPEPEFDVAFLMRKWNAQNGRCALTGAPLSCIPHDPYGVTLDRIDPAKPYTRRNTALVARWANAAKGEGSIADFHKQCRQAVRGYYARAAA